MQLAFVPSPASSPSSTTISADATAHHKAYPRSTRKTLRVPTSRSKPATHAGVDSYMHQMEYRSDTVHTQNLEFLDRAYDFDEFGDIDNEFDGLTITESMDDADLWRFCTGYDIL